MSKLFAELFVAHADCLSPGEKAHHLFEAARVLRAEPTAARSYRARLALTVVGELLRPDDERPHRVAYDQAARDWCQQAHEPLGFKVLVSELEAAAYDLAAEHQLCMMCWRDVADCLGHGPEGPAFGSDAYAEGQARRCGLGER